MAVTKPVLICRWEDTSSLYLNVMDAVYQVSFRISSLYLLLPVVIPTALLDEQVDISTLSPYWLLARLQFSPTTLFFIEGMAQLPIQMCYGDGFVTDAALIQQYSLSDPRPFFDAVLQRPYLNNVVISPHYYGPSVSQNTAKYANFS